MGIGVWGLGFGVWGLGFGVWGLGFGVWGLGFGVWGLGFGVWGLGFGASQKPHSGPHTTSEKDSFRILRLGASGLDHGELHLGSPETISDNKGSIHDK